MKDNRKNSKGKKPFYSKRKGFKPNGSDRPNEKESFEKERSFFNDPAWYNRNPSLVEAAARIPFTYRPGSSYTFGTSQAGAAPKVIKSSIPGVMAINWIPFFPSNKQVLDPVSIAAKEIYAKVRANFSGSLDADPPDFVLYLLALDNIYAYIGALKRIYRIISTYSPDNFMLPTGLLMAMGFSQDDIEALTAEKTLLFQYINELVLMTKKFRCPAVFPLFNRHYWLNDNVYCDSNVINGQLYVFNQQGYYFWQAQPDSNDVMVGALQMVRTPWNKAGSDSTVTVEELYDSGKLLISQLAESDDAYTISGYLLKAYGDEASFGVDLLDPLERFAPLYVPEVLEQIRNSHGVDIPLNSTLTQVKLVQDVATNTIIQQPSTFTISTPTGTPLMIPTIQVDLEPLIPSPMEVIEATRLLTSLNIVSSASDYTSATVEVLCGSELVLPMTVVLCKADGTFSVSTVKHDFWPFTGAIQKILTDIISVSNFHMHPRVRLITGNNDYCGIVGDIRNMTVISVDQFKEINKICVYSLLNSFSE